jgi:hypothetical protein
MSFIRQEITLPDGRVSVRYVREGAGTQLKHAIHATLDALPMPSGIRVAIKNCPGCARREEGINQAEAKVRSALGLKN